MIGKSLSERHSLPALEDGDAKTILQKVVAKRAAEIIEIRARGPEMIAFVVVDADDGSVRFCRTLGLEMKRGGTGIFGLGGEDAARIVPTALPAASSRRAWLAAPCAPKETKVVLVAGGIAFVSLTSESGTVSLSLA